MGRARDFVLTDDYAITHRFSWTVKDARDADEPKHVQESTRLLIFALSEPRFSAQMLNQLYAIMALPDANVYRRINFQYP